ncbi:MAG TPA: heme-binding protein, partial [Sphingomonadaceae bacterium]|nr:heme-binding protein [Sphingomonadaceae bacterium]
MIVRSRVSACVLATALVLASCGGDSNDTTPPPTPGTPTPTSFYTAPDAVALTSDEVGRILAQAVGEAQAQGLPSVIAVVDRVGNVLAVYRMDGANPIAAIPVPATAGGVAFDAQGVSVPAAMGAIAKAITAAYLSSAGNAFTTRTASDIVQQHFPLAPNTVGLESGPLFGVQFSSLPCSDLNRRFGADAMTGPKRSPLGLAADPGGIPLYKNGFVVGAVGIMGDGVYGADDNAIAPDANNAEEVIALAASRGF